MTEFTESMRAEIDALSKEPLKPRIKPDTPTEPAVLPYSFIIMDAEGKTHDQAALVESFIADLAKKIEADGHWTVQELAQGTLAIGLAVGLMPTTTKIKRLVVKQLITEHFFNRLPPRLGAGIPLQKWIAGRFLKPQALKLANRVIDLVDMLLARAKCS
jgi:hypothetical protein